MNLARYFLLITMALALLCGGVDAARAQTNFPTIELAWAWDGYVRTPGWVELRVTATNEGADWQGELRITDGENDVVYTYPLELPAHSYKHYRIPLFVASMFRWQVELRHQNGDTQAHEFSGLQNPGRNRVCVMADAMGLATLGERHHCASTLLVTQLAELPEAPMVWETIDVLLLNGLPSAELTSAQAEALLAWVAAGGRLIVGGGPLLAQTLENLPEPLRVARVGDVRILDSLGWQDQVAVARLTPTTGEVLWQVDGVPVAVAAQVGAGRIHIVGWDIATPGSLNWIARLWEGAPMPAVPAPVPADSAVGDPDALYVPQSYTLLEVPASVVPAVWQWLLLFPLYMLVMGPGTLLIIRRLKRPILAWALIPLWIASALLILSLALSGSFNRALPLIQQIAIARVPAPDLPARYIQATAIYAPRNRRVHWASTGAPRPLLGQYLFDTWSNQGDAFEATVRFEEDAYAIRVPNPLGVITWGEAGLYLPPKLETDLTIVARKSGLSLEGTLWSEVPVDHAIILFNNGFQELRVGSDIAAQHMQSISVTLDEAYSARYNHVCNRIAETSTSYYYPPPLTSIEQQELFEQSRACYAAVQVPGVPAPVQRIGGTHLGKSCLIYTIPCPSKTTGDTQISLQPAPNYSENGWMDEMGAIYLHSTQTTVQFILPVYLDFEAPERIVIALTAPTWDSASMVVADYLASLEVWNWRTETWLTFSGDSLNAPMSVAASAADYVNEIEGVRFRLTPHAPDPPVFNATVTLYGQW